MIDSSKIRTDELRSVDALWKVSVLEEVETFEILGENADICESVIIVNFRVIDYISEGVNEELDNRLTCLFVVWYVKDDNPLELTDVRSLAPACAERSLNYNSDGFS